MMTRSTSLTTSAAVLAALTAGLTLSAAPAAAKTEDVIVPMSCRATPSSVPIGGKDFHSSGINATVTSPDTLAVGETGEISFQIHPIHIDMPKLPLGAKFVDASRMKVDFRIPDQLRFIKATIASSRTSIKGFTAKLVNESGREDPNGRILRLVGADDATVGNSTNVSTNKAGGIIVPVDDTEMTISFPQVIIRFEAVTPGAAKFGVNAAGKASQYNVDENFFSILVHLHAPVAGDVWASARCTPRYHEEDPADPVLALIATVNVVQPKKPLGPSEFEKDLSSITDAVIANPQYLALLADLG